MRSNSLKHTVMCCLAAVSALAASSAFAQQSASQPASAASAPENLRQIQSRTAVGGVLSGVSPEALADAESRMKQSLQSLTDAYQRALPAQEKQYQGAQRKVDQIANEALQLEREKYLDFLGIDPQGSSTVYIFVSWSMPMELLRAYILDAMWSGATLIFRGVPPGKDLAEFLTKDLRNLVYGRQGSFFAIDPRLFDAYGVTEVPSIVFATNRDQLICKGLGKQEFEHKGKVLSYDKCEKRADDEYWKLSGAVSTTYALNEFLEQGAVGVKPFVDAIKKGYAVGAVPEKGQKPFAGNWEDPLGPHELEKMRLFEKAEQEAKEKGLDTKPRYR